MSQVMERVRGLFRSAFAGTRLEYPAPSAPSVDWAPIIWAYAQSLWPGGWSLKNSDRAEKEYGSFGRGLAFGQIRVTKAEQYGVTFTVLGEQKLTAAQLKRALEMALAEQGLTDRVRLEPGTFGEGFTGVLVNDKDPLPAHGSCGIRNGKSFSWRQFFTADCWGGGGLRRMEATGVESLRVLLRAAEILGYAAGPKHYANESTVRIEDIVSYAVRWEDPQTHARYLDVLWRPELVVASYTQGGGKSDERTEGAFKGEVLASHTDGKWWPKKVINNRPVYAAVSKEPTPHMLRAREKFRTEEADWKRCGVPGCDRSAAWDVYVARMVMEDFAGESSHGSIHRSCDDPAHLEKQKTSHGGVKVDVHPTHHEKW